MGVLTGVWQVSPKALKRIQADPGRLDCLEYPEERSVEELGYEPGTKLPHISLDKSWEDLVRVLEGCGHPAAARALERLKELDYEPAWARYATPAAVQKLARLLAEVQPAALKKCVAQRGLTTYNGGPMAEMLDYVVSHLKAMTRACAKSAEAGEALVFLTA